MLSLEQARHILHKHVSQPHLLIHALAVSSAMGALAAHFGADADYWRAIGYLHDVDYEKYPDEHLRHAEEILRAEQVDAADIRAVLSHGWGLCSEVEPLNELEKCLYAVDELTGIVMAAALMRPQGIADLEVKSLMKKFKDKSFAARCDREVIRAGCEILGMELSQLMALTIEGMRGEMDALGLDPKE
ncbi:MAG: HDIG domain-containing protein [Clostridiales bacterium]|nr:HDIG domain-containing protein [Clostridiales bacterium]